MTVRVDNFYYSGELPENSGNRLGRSYITCRQSEISTDNLKIWPDCPKDNLIFNPYFERCMGYLEHWGHLRHKGHLGHTVSPNKLKISLDSRSCKLKAFTGPKKHHQTVGGQLPILTWWDKKYLDCRSDILSDLPLFYQTCLVGPMLLRKTGHMGSTVILLVKNVAFKSFLLSISNTQCWFKAGSLSVMLARQRSSIENSYFNY